MSGCGCRCAGGCEREAAARAWLRLRPTHRTENRFTCVTPSPPTAAHDQHVFSAEQMASWHSGGWTGVWVLQCALVVIRAQAASFWIACYAEQRNYTAHFMGSFSGIPCECGYIWRLTSRNSAGDWVSLVNFGMQKGLSMFKLIMAKDNQWVNIILSDQLVYCTVFSSYIFFLLI